MRFKNDSQRRAVFAKMNKFSRFDPVEQLMVKKKYGKGMAEFPFEPKRDYDGSMFVNVGESAKVLEALNETNIPSLERLRDRISNAMDRKMVDREFSGEVHITPEELQELKSYNIITTNQKDPYEDLVKYLESVGITWEEYAEGKPVPTAVFDPNVPTPIEEYESGKKRNLNSLKSPFGYKVDPKHAAWFEVEADDKNINKHKKLI